MKKWGQKREDLVRQELLGRSLPKSYGDEMVSEEEIIMLQYAYSDAFEQSVDLYTSHLFKKFANIFQPTIVSASLRQAMLAFTAAGMPNPSLRERVQDHSNRAFQELRRKISSPTLDEADLFAACLLACLSRYEQNLDKFCIHVGGFMLIMEELVRKAKASGGSNTFSMLWPLGRDLILKSSQQVPKASEYVLQFCTSSVALLGNQSFLCRSEYTKEILDHEKQFQTLAFRQSVSIYYVLLRRCLRYTVCHEMGGMDAQNYRTVLSIVSEVTADLTSREAKILLSRLRTVLSFKVPYQNDEWKNAVAILLRFYACRMLISLLEVNGILQKLSSQGAIYESTSFLEFIHGGGPFSDQYKFLFASPKLRVLLPRMLCIAGLSLNSIQYPDCMLPLLWFLTDFYRVNMGYLATPNVGGITYGRLLGAILGFPRCPENSRAPRHAMYN